MSTIRRPKIPRGGGHTAETLLAIRKRVEMAEFRAIEAKAHRDDAIVRAAKEGFSTHRISVLLDLTEGRVRQILRAGPGAKDGVVNGTLARIRLDELGDFEGAVLLHADENGENTEDI